MRAFPVFRTLLEGLKGPADVDFFNAPRSGIPRDTEAVIRNDHAFAELI